MERNPTGYSNHDKGKENEKISEINWDADAIGNVKTIPDGIRWVYLRLIAIQLWDISLIKPISGYHHRCRFPNWIRKNIIGILPSITQGYRLLQRWKACEQKLFQWSGSNRLGFKEFKAKVAILAVWSLLYYLTNAYSRWCPYAVGKTIGQSVNDRYGKTCKPYFKPGTAGAALY